ncbi:MAG: aromatic ring-hydroxylating dioxygenase subunit alpha [Gammaproteobacteria bacterium]
MSSPPTALPAQFFTDAAVFRRARERVFFRTWQYACHAGEIAKPGDFAAFSICNQDVFVIRGRDHGIRGFYNVCRHRGHKLLGGEPHPGGGDGATRGNRAVIVCPYHAWSYETSGELRAAPHAANIARGAIRLSAVRAEEFLGFVFINLDADAKPMDEWYPGVREAAGAACAQLEQRAPAHARAVKARCNWLVAVENYNECYHCKTAHPSFAKGVIDPATYRIAPFGGGHCLRHTSAGASGGASNGAWYDFGDAAGAAYASFYLWPAAAIQIYPGGVVNTYHWRPLGVDATEVHRRWYSRDGAVSRQLQTLIDLDYETTMREDASLLENVQRGVGSRGYVPGPLVINPGGIDNESSIAVLHQWAREALQL